MSTFNILKFLPVLYFCFQNIICEEFIRPEFCAGKVLASLESYLTVESTSVIQCAVRCSLDNNCLSVSYRKTDKTCFLNFGLLTNDCGNGVTLINTVYYQKKKAVKKCLNNGTLINNDCVCYGGYVGTYCERLMTDCSEGFREMYKDGNLGFYKILPPGAPKPFDVICKMKFGGRSIVLKYYNDSLTMNRTWSEYRDGFADNELDGWIGLEKLYWLSRSQTFDLYVQFKRSSTPAIFIKIVYENFEIGDSSTNYQLLNAQLNNARSGLTVVDCLSALVGSSFSSYDMDNNIVPGLNCPLSYGSAWWYNGACAQCNPMGDLHNATGGARLGVDNENFWEPIPWRPEGITIWFQN